MRLAALAVGEVNKSFKKKINSFSGEEKNIISYKIRRGGKYKWMEGNFGCYISLC